MTMIFKKLLLLTVCLTVFNTLNANETVRVKGAVGRWEVSNDITPKQAEERALFEAKKEALRKAGVMENVWSVFGQVTSENGSEFVEAYSSVSTLAINGMVNVIDMAIEDEWDPGLKRGFKVVTIDAYVRKDDTTEDKSFQIQVEGIEPIYKDGEFLKFTVKTHGADSYLKVFWFGEDGAAIVYPTDNDGNGDRLFEAGKKYEFPLPHPDFYMMSKSDPDADFEKVNIIITATKKDYLYNMENTDYQSIIQWIYNIPADQRTLFHQLTLIK